MASFFASSQPGVTGANDIPSPSSDDDKNQPPQEAAKRIADFVKEDPQALYTFDSRLSRESDSVADLCRTRTDGGGVSCIKVAIESKALFKSMQAHGFYCALPAEPHRTHMECRLIPGRKV